MNVNINGVQRIIKACSLLAYLAENNFLLKTVVIEYNGKIIPQDCWEQITLAENDTLEILSFVGGG